MMVGVVVCAHFMCVTLHVPCMLIVRSIAACYLVSCRVPFCTLACPLPVLTVGYCFGRATACRRRNRAQSRGQCMPHNAAHNSSEREGPHTFFLAAHAFGRTSETSKTMETAQWCGGTSTHT
jgi:hypothetical protein